MLVRTYFLKKVKYKIGPFVFGVYSIGPWVFKSERISHYAFCDKSKINPVVYILFVNKFFLFFLGQFLASEDNVGATIRGLGVE
jgi:hypothetical protein